MKNQFEFLIAITVVVILSGCGATTREITRMSQSERTDVFVEVPKEEAASADFVDLVIKATIKTSLKGYFLLELAIPRSLLRGHLIEGRVRETAGFSVEQSSFIPCQLAAGY